MSLFEIYYRALQHLSPAKNRVLLICAANIVLAIVTIAEPILFGRIIDAISEKSGLTATLWLWASFGVFNIVAYVAIARGADRIAHERRAGVLVESFERVISMPLAWHHQRGTSNALHTMLRAVEALFGLWLEFMRQHLTTAVALVLLVPAAISLDLRMACGAGAARRRLCRHRPAGDAQDQAAARRRSRATTTASSRMSATASATSPCCRATTASAKRRGRCANSRAT